MNNFIHSITVFNDNISDVAIRLGDCQYYSDKISDQLLSDFNVDKNTARLNVFELLKILEKRKDLTVSFFCVKSNKQFHIYSDFFNLDGAFYDSFSFFNDMDNVFMMCEKIQSEINLNLIQFGKTLFHFTISDNEKEFSNGIWRKDYIKAFDKNNALPNICDIETSLKFLSQNYSKTKKQMETYLKNNSLFEDNYIL